MNNNRNIILTKYFWIGLSRGQISVRPLNGEIVIVFSSSIGRLSVNPPSIYLYLPIKGGTNPENIGIKALANNVCNKKLVWLTHKLNKILFCIQFCFQNVYESWNHCVVY